MRHRSRIVLLGALASTRLAAAAAGSLPRGVGPEFARFYDSKDGFTCIGNPSIKLSLSQVNDNSCDCPDGSDEPGTSACAFIDHLSPEQPLPASLSGTTNTSSALPGFWCENAGHVGAYVPFMYVNDGVCDYELCCDGSEEFAGVGGVKCPNRCAEIGKEHRRVEEARRKGKERAAKKRSALVAEAEGLRKKVESKVATLKDEIAGLTFKRDELQRKFEEAERAEKGRVVQTEGQGGKLGVLLGLSKKRVGELRETLEKVKDQRDDLQEKVDELEGILKKFKDEYNPNFNDEGVKQAVYAWEDYSAGLEKEVKVDLQEDDLTEVLKADSDTSGINWTEFEFDDVADTDILYNLEAYLPSFLRDFLHTKLVSLRIWLIENGMLADNPSGHGESRLVAAAREAYENLRNDVSSKETTLTNEENDLSKDYGPDDIFRALQGKCATIEAGEYEYELCWLDKTTQKSKSGHGSTNMGNYASMDTQIADEEERIDGKSLGKGPRTVLRYEDGQGCWNGPNRKTDVWLACAETDEIWRVAEAEKCVYKMEVGTPAACEDVGEPVIGVKDEL